MPHKGKKVFVALSGGVDSAVAALLLKQQGFNVRAVFMREFDYVDIVPKSSALLSCAQEDDRLSAQAVAEHLSIPFEAWDFRKEYFDHVVQYLFDGYKKGITPNPDIMCNTHVKFGAFLKRARKEGAATIATGHYVIKKSTREGFQLHIAKDRNKDQSYFLYGLMQQQLNRSLFPLGNLLKSEVRDLAKKAKLPNWDRKDSQGICFVGKVAMKDFLKDAVRTKKGALLTCDGQQVGTHDGAEYYTIGQRHGLGFGGGADAYYVVGKDIKQNVVYVGHQNDSALYKKELICKAIHWIGAAPKLPCIVLARIRYRQPLQRCRVQIGSKRGTLHIVFFSKQRAVTSGQAIVFYRGSAMLGGGIITTTPAVDTFLR
ncbi:MAG: tRNA 2-thiouridine(34) synthase MnmA [Patescibacteria group bacterium]